LAGESHEGQAFHSHIRDWHCRYNIRRGRVVICELQCGSTTRRNES
jgi:hypothetical protein